MFGQNTDLTHEIKVKVDGQPLNINGVELVEFSFNDLIKIYPSTSVQYENDSFYIRLTQEETQRFEGAVAVQVRVKFVDGSIPLSCKKTVLVNESLSKGVI